MTDSQVDPLVSEKPAKVTPGATQPKAEPANIPAEPSKKPDKKVEDAAPVEASASVVVSGEWATLQRAVESLRRGKEFSSRLYNALQASNIRTYQDAKKRPMAVVAALNSAQNFDAMHIIDALREATSDGS